MSLSDPMYDQIENIVRATYKNSCIVWIEKIRNEELEKKFNDYKSKINPPNIKRLFHGTSEQVARIIIEEGFDPSKNKVSAHGIGVYFSTRALYSIEYCHRTEGKDYVFMFVCDVVTGKPCKGKANTQISPEYDSATDNLARPDMYIVNKREAALPLYLVAFYPDVNKI